jgi:YrbI family 3-deoxy-D-manno-octulosonate 8-phosphate phosphatase
MTEQPGNVIAIIPARGGSKRVASKNLTPIAGRPLLSHTISHARAAERVSEVYVSTDDPAIAELARAEGAEVVERPAELAGDLATSEVALEHVLQVRAEGGKPEPELVVFLQCTSPVRRPGEIDAAIEKLEAEGADSLFSAHPDPGLFWVKRDDGSPEPVNYDPANRLREQEMAQQYRENGSIYVFRPAVLSEHGARLGGRIAIHDMDFWSSFQVDDPRDVELIAWILAHPAYAPPVSWPDRIELVVFDFDGVMTDNGVLVRGDGDESVRCDRADGWGVARLRDAGVPMVVLSTEAHPVVAARCAKLGIPAVQGIDDKEAELRRLLAERGTDAAHVVYVGNDVNDLGCLRLVGMPVAVADADPKVLAETRLVLSRSGGHGAVRELSELLLARLGEPEGR